MTSNSITEALERLAPAQSFAYDWNDVLKRASVGAPAHRRARPRKRWLLSVAIALVVLSPLGAIAASEDWWFLDSPGAPAPSNPPPLVVKTGSWDGKEWLLVAYRSEDGALCFSMNPASSPMSTGVGAALNCGGWDTYPPSGPNLAGGITYLSGTSPELPTYVVGPVVDDAAEVEIHFADGEVVRTPTFDAPSSLGALRFYAVRAPATGSVVEKLVGLDRDGRLVACLAVGGQDGC
ncbi:MAG: hypothetical protein H0U00_13375 [Actinobacteria bacterium]|nr:hypothetical protein [Actinomycetota bacterium]